MKTKDITLTGLFAALIFTGTFFFKIPLSFAGGYTHLGDGILILSVLFLGWKYGTLAAGIGMGLSDLIGGYLIWVAPTAILKSLWAFMIGLFAYHICKGNKYGWYLGAIVGGILQIVGYTIVKIPLYGVKPALIELPILSLQTIIGITLAAVIYHASKKAVNYKIHC